MKIEELYEKILADENLRKSYAEAMKEGKLAEFLTANDCNATGEEIKAFLDGKKELTDDELELVSGGGCDVEACVDEVIDYLPASGLLRKGKEIVKDAIDAVGDIIN